MLRRAVILLIALTSLVATAGCRGDSEPGASRLRSPSMTGDGMDGGAEAGEPASYLQHLP